MFSPFLVVTLILATGSLLKSVRTVLDSFASTTECGEDGATRVYLLLALYVSLLDLNFKRFFCCCSFSSRARGGHVALLRCLRRNGVDRGGGRGSASDGEASNGVATEGCRQRLRGPHWRLECSVSTVSQTFSVNREAQKRM